MQDALIQEYKQDLKAQYDHEEKNTTYCHLNVIPFFDIHILRGTMQMRFIFQKRTCIRDIKHHRNVNIP